MDGSEISLPQIPDQTDVSPRELQLLQPLLRREIQKCAILDPLGKSGGAVCEIGPQQSLVDSRRAKHQRTGGLVRVLRRELLRKIKPRLVGGYGWSAGDLARTSRAGPAEVFRSPLSSQQVEDECEEESGYDEREAGRYTNTCNGPRAERGGRGVGGWGGGRRRGGAVFSRSGVVV